MPAASERRSWAGTCAKCACSAEKALALTTPASVKPGRYRPTDKTLAFLEGLSLAGEDGLLAWLTKIAVEAALEGEMDAHLGYAKHEAAGRDGGNSGNGTRAKALLTRVGPVDVEVPGDRDASFRPVLVAKRQRRVGGVDEIVLSLSARGLTTGEVAAQLGEVYGAQVSRETIWRITDRALEGMAEWQSRAAGRRPVCRVIFIDAIDVKIRDGQVPTDRSRWCWA